MDPGRYIDLQPPQRKIPIHGRRPGSCGVGSPWGLDRRAVRDPLLCVFTLVCLLRRSTRKHWEWLCCRYVRSTSDLFPIWMTCSVRAAPAPVIGMEPRRRSGIRDATVALGRHVIASLDARGPPGSNASSHQH